MSLGPQICDQLLRCAAIHLNVFATVVVLDLKEPEENGIRKRMEKSGRGYSWEFFSVLHIQVFKIK